MNENNSHWPPEFWQLVECAREETIAPEQAEAIASLLSENPAARREYLAHIQLQADIHLLDRSQRSLEKALARLDEQIQASARSHNAACLPEHSGIDGTSPAPVFPPLPIDSGLSEPFTPFASRLFNAGTLGWVLFAVAIAFIASLLVFTDRSGKQVAERDVPDFDTPSVHILSGTTKLLLPKIGQVIVDGPAEFDMLNPMRARLTRGRIKVHVTEPTGHGFVVETPYGNVTDLGTEFGLDVSGAGEAGLVVFDGVVDLEFCPQPEKPDILQVERLFGGEGVLFGEQGRLDRIMSIVTGNGETFKQIGELDDNDQDPVIVRISDNRRATETKKFYEIVRGGFCEDALAYVDRPEHEWNGVTSRGLPKYLIGADYVKPFCSDKRLNDIEISVTLARPAKLYVLFDSRLQPPEWLKKDFVKNGDVVGVDVGRHGDNTRYKQGKGPGVSIDNRLYVWERTVEEASTVVLGGNSAHTFRSAMYGIVAVPLDVKNRK